MNKKAINQQRGSIILPFVVSLLVGLILLGGVQVGYYFFMKRELQNTADLAVLSGVQMLSEGCQNAKDTGRANALENFNRHDVLTAQQLNFECGTWRSNLPAPRHFVNTPDTEGNYNALRVSINYEALPFMPFSAGSTIAVEAIAKSNVPVAAFQVGSQLLRFDNTALLGGLLGLVGLDINSLTLLDSEGLANTKITPAGLLDLLGVDLGIGGLSALTPKGVADINNLTLLNLLDASVNAVTDSTLGVQLSALRTKLLGLNLGSIKIPLGSADGQSGLFAFVGTGRDDPLDAALDVQLGLGDILKTAIAIGANGHALEVPGLNVLGLAKAKLSIVEPPVIAIGPVGTTGHSAQIRLWLDVDTNELLGGVLKWLMYDILGTRIHLPISLDIVSGTGSLEKLECSRNPPTMDILVKSKILNVCVGKMDAASIMSDKRSCDVGLAEAELIKLLHIPVLSGKLHIPALQYNELIENLEVGQTVSTKPNPLQLGDTVDNLVTGLLNLLSGLFRPPVSMDGWEGTYTKNPSLLPYLLESYLEASKDKAGFYNVADVTNLVLSGKGNPDETGYIPPLLKDDFTFEHAIPVSCVVAACPESAWKSGTFSEAFHAYTSIPYGITNILGIPWMGDKLRLQNCAGLLSALLGWNSCVKHNLTQLFKDHQAQIEAIDPDSQEIKSLLDKDSDTVTCNGALCVLLKPILNLLKPILNGIGLLLTSLLDDVLGLELGRTDVTALAIECDPAQLVY